MAERIVDINNRDEFVEALVALITSDGCHTRHKSGCLAPTCRECIDRFFNVHSHLLPEIDVAPVKHGFWGKETLPFKDKQGVQHFGSCCSNCGAILDRTKFCGECGAKMDGKEQE